MKLKAKLVLLFTTVTVLAVCIVSVFGYMYIQKEVTKDINDKYSVIVSGLTNKMSGWLNSKVGTAKGAASTLDSLGMNEINLSQSKLVAMQTTINDADISDLYVGTAASGKMFDGSDWVPEPGTYDPRQRPWYLEAQKAGNLVVTNPFMEAGSKEYCVTVAVPMKNPDGSLKGVLGENLLLSTMTDMVNKMDLGNAGYAFLLDKNGLALAYPDKNLVHTNLASNPDLKDLVTDILYHDKGTRTYKYKDASKITMFEKIPSTGWTLGVTLKQDVVNAAINSLKIKYIIFTIAIALIMVLIAFVLANNITKPLIELTESSKKMSIGDLTVKTKVNGKDEISDLAMAYNLMTENLKNLIQKIGIAANAVTRSSHEMSQIAEDTGKSSKEIFATVDELAKGAYEQADSVQKGAIMVNQMTVSINAITENAGNSAKMAEQAKIAIDHGYKAILNQAKLMEDNKSTTKNVSEAVELLNEKSQMIGQIVDAIGNIASQTNLLALNAAIEAARAGGHGKGFAVVADEVRKLAEQSAASSNEITSLLKEIQTRTSESVEEMKIAKGVVLQQESAVNQTKECFDEIKHSVEGIVTQVYNVSSSANEANKNAERVSEVIANIAAVSEESATATEEVASTTESQMEAVIKIGTASNDLVNEAKNLLGEVQKFKI